VLGRDRDAKCSEHYSEKEAEFAPGRTEDSPLFVKDSARRRRLERRKNTQRILGQR